MAWQRTVSFFRLNFGDLSGDDHYRYVKWGAMELTRYGSGGYYFRDVRAEFTSDVFSSMQLRR